MSWFDLLLNDQGYITCFGYAVTIAKLSCGFPSIYVLSCQNPFIVSIPADVDIGGAEDQLSPLIENDELVLYNSSVVRVEHVVVQRRRVVASTGSSAVDGRESSWEFHESACGGFYSVFQRIRCWTVERVIGCQGYVVDPWLGVEVNRIRFSAHLTITKVPQELKGFVIRQVHKLEFLLRFV